MARDPQLHQERNERIRSEFEAMRTKRNKYGELMMHPESIIGKLHRRHLLTKRSIEDIIYRRSAA